MCTASNAVLGSRRQVPAYNVLVIMRKTSNEAGSLGIRDLLDRDTGALQRLVSQLQKNALLRINGSRLCG